MSVQNNSNSSTQPFKISLTPSSDRHASNEFEPTTPTSQSGLFITRSLVGGANSMTPIVSSTCASVDSDSDYQVGGGSTAGGGGSVYANGGGAQSSATNTPSRPLSRNSVMSGMSTTATKDGVEGNRIHRFHDPQGYTKWISSTMPDDISFTTSSSSNNLTDGEEEEGMMMQENEANSIINNEEVDNNRDTPEYMEDNTVLDVAAAVAAKARIAREDQEDEYNYDYYDQNSISSTDPPSIPGGSGGAGTDGKLFSKSLFNRAS